ncbi:MAG: hypothetical protein KKC86_11555, partial [Bacteroidetes bacterium]|nr:hypothetical protein [Bacteroidota bacterium]
ARPVKRVLQREVLNVLSKIILAGSIDREKPIHITYEDGKLVFTNE